MPNHDVFWAVLLDKAMLEYAVNPLLNIALACGGLGYKRLAQPCLRTDVARNRYVAKFLTETTDPEATLVMLDADHEHPMDIVERLAAHTHGVIGALAYRRSTPFDPCAMIRGADGQLHAIATWAADADVLPCTVVGTGAIAIKRWVFEKLDAEGTPYPYFQYFYPPQTTMFPTEDVYFGMICDRAGIAHHVDVRLITPHLTVGQIDETSWAQWLEEHPDQLVDNAPPPPAPGNGAKPANGKAPDGPAYMPARIRTRVDG